MMNEQKQRGIRSAQLLLLFIAFLITAATKEEAIASFGRYHALVIGNKNYQHLTVLETPLRDAQEIARILKKRYGFEVTLLLDKKREETVRALGRLRSTMTKQDNLLIYYAGHGYLDTVTDVGYWQPVDAERDIDVNWIPSTYLMALFKGLQSNHILVIADSCFSGNLLTRDSGAALNYGKDVWLQRMRDSKSRTAFTSGGEEPVVDGGGGNHSIFAKALIDTLRNNSKILDGQSLFDQVKRSVVANAAQTPRYGAIRMTEHEFGDFLFVPKGVATLPVTPVGTGSIKKLRGIQQSIDRDKHDWDLLSKNGQSGLESYLALHRNGSYASEASRRLKQLQRRPVQAASTTTTNNRSAPTRTTRKPLSKEQQAQALYEWQQDIIYSNDSRTVEQFLQRFPTGSHVQDARSKLADLRAQGF
ncbi:MAG: caspase family protein [Candidatus Electrothrix sp. ATG1]|nr:caspase family protein [Candidatus Electrothrix sp. ATG1]